MVVFVSPFLGVPLQVLDGVVVVDVSVRFHLTGGTHEITHSGYAVDSARRQVLRASGVSTHRRFAVAGQLLVPAMRARHVRRCAWRLACTHQCGYSCTSTAMRQLQYMRHSLRAVQRFQTIGEAKRQSACHDIPLKSVFCGLLVIVESSTSHLLLLLLL